MLSFYVVFIADSKPDFLFTYAIGTQLGLYIFYYKALRNLSFYFVWFGYGAFHWLLTVFFMDNPANIDETIIKILKNTLPLLITFQVLRGLSLFVQNQELVSPNSSSLTSIHDNRRVNIVDFLLFFTYIIILISPLYA